MATAPEQQTAFAEGLTRLYDEAAIAQRVAELAPQIAEALPGDFVVVAILKGAFVFVADLVRALDRVGRHPSVEFLTLSSYGKGKESSGKVRLVGEAPQEIAGRPVLLVDDVADTRRSLIFAKDLLERQGATRVWTCALIDKPSKRAVDLALDFAGFEIGDLFVVGYGIDYAQRYRHLPYIGAVE